VTSFWNAFRSLLRRGRRVRTPTLIQMEATECGAASLGIVLGYYGRTVPLEKLREECGVSRDGSSAVNILKVARTYGMLASGHKKELETLTELPLPLILFWEFNHFLVLEGISKDRYCLNDPATGPRSVDRRTMDESFTGIALSITPGPDFEPGGERRSPWRPLLRRLAGAREAVIFALLTGVGLVIPGLLEPAFRQVFTDDVISGGQAGWMYPLSLFMAVTAIVAFALSHLQTTALRNQEITMSVIHSGSFLLHLLRLPYTFFQQRYAGELGNRVALNDLVAQRLTRELSSTFLQCITAVFFGCMLAVYSPFMAVVALAASAFLAGVSSLIQRRRADLNERMSMEAGKFAGLALGGIRVIETIKSFGGENTQFVRLAGQLTKLENATMELASCDAVIVPLLPTVTSLAMAFVLYIGGLDVMNGAMTLGMLLAAQTLMLQTLTPVTNLAQLWNTCQDAQASVARLEDVLNYPCSPARPSLEMGAMKRVPSVRLSGRLEIEKLTFGYSPLSPALVEDFSLTLVPGARVALVGSSASGKSTIAKLIGGLLVPWSGRILLDGRPIGEIPGELLRASMSSVDQDVMLCEGTVLENLTLWDHTIPREQVIQAARDADIHEEIASRSGGYDSIVEENGRNFSGGQKQRLEIARSLVRNPSLLVLDEATSALDPPMEERIDRALRKRGCTCLIIAHRLSTIRDCDEIVVLERGRVLERGTHDVLMARGGRYAELIEN
jgi:NHLM bacteriocin system ABC transporter peptidase/ATP-binding protein